MANNCIQSAFQDSNPSILSCVVGFLSPAHAGSTITVNIQGTNPPLGMVVTVTDNKGTVYTKQNIGWDNAIFKGVAGVAGVTTITVTVNAPFGYGSVMKVIATEWSTYSQIAWGDTNYPVGAFFTTLEQGQTINTGIPFSMRIQPTGGYEPPFPFPPPPLNLAVDNTTLPPGINVTIINGLLVGEAPQPYDLLDFTETLPDGTPYGWFVLSGVATTGGSYVIKLTNTDANGEVYVYLFQLNVNAPPIVVVPVSNCCCCCTPIESMNQCISGVM